MSFTNQERIKSRVTSSLKLVLEFGNQLSQLLLKNLNEKQPELKQSSIDLIFYSLGIFTSDFKNLTSKLIEDLRSSLNLKKSKTEKNKFFKNSQEIQLDLIQEMSKEKEIVKLINKLKNEVEANKLFKSRSFKEHSCQVESLYINKIQQQSGNFFL